MRKIWETIKSYMTIKPKKIKPENLKFITYSGNCDTLRRSNFSWDEFKEGELIVGKKYKVITGMLAQWSFVKKDGKIVKDDSGQRYLYHSIKNENNEQIYVWEGFFEENTNL